MNKTACSFPIKKLFWYNGTGPWIFFVFSIFGWKRKGSVGEQVGDRLHVGRAVTKQTWLECLPSRKRGTSTRAVSNGNSQPSFQQKINQFASPLAEILALFPWRLNHDRFIACCDARLLPPSGSAPITPPQNWRTRIAWTAPGASQRDRSSVSIRARLPFRQKSQMESLVSIKFLMMPWRDVLVSWSDFPILDFPPTIQHSPSIIKTALYFTSFPIFFGPHPSSHSSSSSSFFSHFRLPVSHFFVFLFLFYIILKIKFHFLFTMRPTSVTNAFVFGLLGLAPITTALSLPGSADVERRYVVSSFI